MRGKSAGRRPGGVYFGLTDGYAHGVVDLRRDTLTEPHVTLDPRSLNPVEEKLRGPLEDQLSSALQAATAKIRQRYAGESVEQVTTMLLEQARAGLHPDIAAGFHPDHEQLRHVAETIVGQAR
ncbi:hypothetical protein Ate01nite_21500 [Actinoplanes teichomyceticus]|nr:hypothetical protein Ate01nite_21500 [Actinoplanes teichomyceticus]